MDKINAEISGDGFHKDADGLWPGEYHRFKVTLEYKGATMTLTYRQGLGVDNDPTAENVLYCVLADYTGTDDNFEDWADHYGYDQDSRAAEKVYRACVEQSAQFEKMMGADLPLVIAELENVDFEKVAEMWAGVTK